MACPFLFYRMREADWKDRLLLRLGRLRAVRVTGDSMRPAISDGDVILASRSKRVGVGDIVLADHPYKNVAVVKRVTAVTDGRYELRGDDASESSDSRTFGTLSRKDIRGKVVCVLRRSN
jgi:nickel-type superoxide dismutase maturation protease